MYYETEQKRESYKRMLRSLKHNQKELFENTEDGLKQYREFERDTLKTFRESALYKKMYGETEVRAEIHTGEMGA